VLAQESPVGSKKENAAVKRAALALNHADHKVNRIGAGRLAKRIDCGTGNFHGTFTVTLEVFATFITARADYGAKVEAARIAGDERLRKEHQLCTLAGGIAREIERFFKGAFAIKCCGRSLHHGYRYSVAIRDCLRLSHGRSENYTGKAAIIAAPDGIK
jgi:hypothetical protein